MPPLGVHGAAKEADHLARVALPPGVTDGDERRGVITRIELAKGEQHLLVATRAALAGDGPADGGAGLFLEQADERRSAAISRGQFGQPEDEADAQFLALLVVFVEQLACPGGSSGCAQGSWSRIWPARVLTSGQRGWRNASSTAGRAANPPTPSRAVAASRTWGSSAARSRIACGTQFFPDTTTGSAAAAGSPRPRQGSRTATSTKRVRHEAKIEGGGARPNRMPARARPQGESDAGGDLTKTIANNPRPPTCHSEGRLRPKNLALRFCGAGFSLQLQKQAKACITTKNRPHPNPLPRNTEGEGVRAGFSVASDPQNGTALP